MVDRSVENLALLERGRYQIETFLLRFGDSYRDLLNYAAIPVVITPELLHYLRVEFTPHLPWVAEVDLLLSDLFRVMGYEQYAMQSYVRVVLLESLDTQLGHGKIEAAARLLLGYVAQLRQENPYLSDRELTRQRWSAMVFIDDLRAEVAAEISQEFEQSLEKGKSQQDLLGLVAITEQLSTQLQEFPQLIKNAQEIGRILRDQTLSSVAMEASISRQLQPTIAGQSLEWFTEEIEVVSISLHNFNFDVFLNSNLADKPQVKIIAKKLEERGLRVWLDEEQLAVGESFQDTIQKGISQSKVVAIFIGSIGLGQWEISELQVTIDQFVDQFVDSRCRRCRVIPVLLPRVEKIPDSLLFLQSLNWVRFENIDDGLALGKLAKGITGIIDFTENLGTGITLETVAIPEGSFMMGSLGSEKDSYSDERPQHEVSVPTFLMGKYQVTQAQWRIVATMPQIEKELNPDPSRFKGDNLPVECVSWLEAVEFCARLSEHTKREYRLPSEAEWEYACRAGTTTAYSFGDDAAELENYAWYNKNSGKETHPVGEKPPNGFGLHDMHGNVREWCADDWHDSYKNAPSDGRAWIDNDNRSQSENVRKLLRGGSWRNNAKYCRSAFRSNLAARLQFFNSGFRVVCSLQ